MTHRILKSQRTAIIAGKLPSCPPSPTAIARNDAAPQRPETTTLRPPPSTESKPRSKQQQFDLSEKENNEPKRSNNNIDLDDAMEIDSSSNDDGSGDSLALSLSSSESECSSTSPRNSSTAEMNQRIDREVLSFTDSSAKRLQYNSNNSSNSNENESTISSSSDDLEGEDIDDDGTECSGDTVVHNDFPSPPKNATEEEMNLYYWEVCYGERAQEMKSSLEKQKREGLRSAPAKSCLSTKKLKNTTTASSMTPRRLHPSPPGIEPIEDSNLSTPNDDETPPTAVATTKKSHSAVKFGTNSAAEFDKLQPITEMTPMPSDIVQEIFPSESKEEPPEEQEVSRETAKNVKMLAEWDDLFDDEDDLEKSTTPKKRGKRGRKRTPYKSSRNRRPSKSRRDSTVFSKERRSLLEESDEEDIMLPMSVTIDPNEYTSPSTMAASERDSLESEMTTTDKRESMESACISPNSLASSQILRETPKSARTSSSTILRAVHASGAELPSNSPQAVQGNVLMPNQLNYSPSTSSGQSSNSSPTNSDNLSLGSDIMSLFTQHTIDSESEADTFQTSLAFLSNQPLQMLLLRIGDMIQMMQALDKDSLQFLNENVLHSLTPATALAFVKGQKDRDSLSSQLFHSIFSTNNVNDIRSLKFFETILQNEISNACDNQSMFAPSAKNNTSAAIDHNESIASCVKTCYDNATYEMSNIELAIVERSLKKLNELLAEKVQVKERGHETVNRKQRSIQNETSTIRALEKQLAIETDRLVRYKCAHQILCSSLELEQNFPIGELSEDIRKSVTSSLELFSFSSSGSHSNFLLLDGSADVTVEIDDDMIKTIGFSVKEGGSAIKFLQAIFLGRMDTATNEVCYPAPIRDCVKSSITHQDIFVDSSCILSRIDSLLKAVKSLENEFSCSVDSAQNNESVELSFSAQQNEEVIKVVFVFESLLTDMWSVTTVPSDVKVSIFSVENDRSQLSILLEQKSHDMLKFASHSDPTLLNRIVNTTMMGACEATI